MLCLAGNSSSVWTTPKALLPTQVIRVCCTRRQTSRPLRHSMSSRSPLSCLCTAMCHAALTRSHTTPSSSAIRPYTHPLNLIREEKRPSTFHRSAVLVSRVQARVKKETELPSRSKLAAWQHGFCWYVHQGNRCLLKPRFHASSPFHVPT
ncbi:hypothetical protein M438DRAFT_128768 [Aureobasidium pullulans EXF-150]|uniref:Uncharacterized protein n=1 Tax=Aureobasidium pullulans EXF-150 TaxID=1043002 RepID=A0A074Y080_AURPU|nr:uncharacterized protein M438DRAFT_128768 [Aureobasidium pullulans EXF-150]KEQ87602.1 hypothetical protein M438DRAFT_128768 [Aureobasidium pullulans EXF-150]